MRPSVLTIAAAVVTAPATADVILVPGDMPTIQGAIDGAVAGDEIVVAAGTWSETIDLLGKSIELRSASGPGATTIDGGGTGDAVLRCTTGETDQTRITGFTITGGDFHAGSAGGGHGVLVVGSSPVFDACRFAANRALLGGGALVDGGAPRFQACLFTSNLASDGGGLAVIGGAAARLDGCDFAGNVAGGGEDCFLVHGAPGCESPACTIAVCAVDAFCCDVQWDADCVLAAEAECNSSVRGGAVHVVGATLIMTDFDLVGNEAVFSSPAVSEGFGSGGGLDAGSGATVRLRDGRVQTNNSPGGGGVHAQGATLLASAVRFEDNVAQSGGAVLSTSSTLLLVNCLIIGNSGAFGSGGVSAIGGAVRIANTLVLENLGQEYGGIAAVPGATIENCIVRDNQDIQIHAAATVRHCNVSGGFPGSGNIDANPVFVNPAGGDYRLAAGSPCIDAGHVWALPDDQPDVDDDGDLVELVSLDADGAPRIADDAAAADTGCGPDAIVDMGPYERAGTPSGPARRGDVNADDAIDVSDLVDLILQWGACPGGCCTADFDVDGAVTVSDLVVLILNWGA